jgi:flagellar hook-associated protein 2
MGNTLRTPINTGNDKYSTLYSLGIKSNSDGTLTLDNAKLSAAVADSPEAVTKLFAGTTSGDGVMDLMSSMVKSFTNSSTGLLTNQINTFKNNATRLTSQIDSEGDRLTKYEARLRTQFENMDSIVSTSNSTLSYLSSLSGS